MGANPAVQLDDRLPAGTISVGLRSSSALPVHPALSSLLSPGLRRGSTVSVGGDPAADTSGALSLLLALLGPASAGGAWCALVGLPTLNVDALLEYGLDPARLVIVTPPDREWTTVVGALIDSFDVVVVRPPARVAPGDVQRLAARTRTREAVLVPYLGSGRGTGTGPETSWPGAAVRLSVRDGQWFGPSNGHRRLLGRQVTAVAERHGRGGPSRSARLWLPAPGGGLAGCESVAAVIDLPARTA